MVPMFCPACAFLMALLCAYRPSVTEMDPWDISIKNLSQNSLRKCEKNWALLRDTVGIKFLGCD